MAQEVSRRDFLGAVGGAAVGLSMMGRVSAADSKPNLLFILTDQHRQDGVGCYGKEGVLTPNLDRLASEGIRFDRAYTAQPVCTPNRGAILSGLYPHNHGALENTWDLDSKVPLLPDLLRSAGYRCGYFGKWHLGDPARDAWETMPVYQGDGRGQKHYYTIDNRQVYQTEVLTKDAIDFIGEDDDRPFCAFASYYPPHPPYSVPEKYEALYRELYPDDENRRKYYAMCTAVDDAVGDLLKTLDEKGIADNTLVVFTTEHGHHFDHRWNDHSKRLCYDVSARIPMLMRFPGAIPKGNVGDSLFSSVDLTPTMLGLMGYAVPEGLDGLNLSDSIRQGGKEGREALVMVNVPFIDKSSRPHQPHLEKGEERCVVSGDWKLILSTVRAPELYYLVSDPGEKQNRWQEMVTSETVANLKAHLQVWADKTRDKLAPVLLAKL
jgi:arylsulfatase A-like enzyme